MHYFSHLTYSQLLLIILGENGIQVAKTGKIKPGAYNGIMDQKTKIIKGLCNGYVC